MAGSGHGRPWPAAVLAVALAVALAACAPLRAFEAARLMAALTGGEAAATGEAAAPARRTGVAYRVDGRVRAGDLYEPGEGARAALVLVPGVTPEGKDDPRLVAFALALARARFAVLVPDIPNLRALKVRPGDARAVADAVRHLAERGGEGTRVGLVAISYAAGPALLAALDDEVGRRLGFVAAIGGYHDIEALATFFTTGFYRERPGGPWRHRTPNAYGKWVFVASNAERLSEPGDRVALAEMARRKLADLAAPVADLAAGLGPEGRAVHALLANRDPERVPALIAALPEAIRADMAGLDLSRRDLSRLQPRLILVHGRDDPIIPYGESLALAAAAGPGRSSLYIVDSLSHVDVGPAGLADAATLWRAVYRLLAERDALAAG